MRRRGWRQHSPPARPSVLASLLVRVPRHLADRAEEARALQVVVQLLGHALGGVVFTVLVEDLHGDLRVLGGLVGVVDAGEALDEARAGLDVQPLGVALLADLNGDVHEHLDEVGVARRVDVAGQLAVLHVRRDERHDGDDAGVREQLGHFGHAADVLRAVLGGEPHVAVEPGADVVAVQHVAELAGVHERALQRVRHGALAGAAEPGHPQDAAALVDELLAHVARHRRLVEPDVRGLAHGRGLELVVRVTSTASSGGGGEELRRVNNRSGSGSAGAHEGREGCGSQLASSPAHGREEHLGFRIKREGGRDGESERKRAKVRGLLEGQQRAREREREGGKKNENKKAEQETKQETQ